MITFNLPEHINNTAICCIGQTPVALLLVSAVLAQLVFCIGIEIFSIGTDVCHIGTDNFVLAQPSVMVNTAVCCFGTDICYSTVHEQSRLLHIFTTMEPSILDTLGPERTVLIIMVSSFQWWKTYSPWQSTVVPAA